MMMKASRKLATLIATTALTAFAAPTFAQTAPPAAGEPAADSADIVVTANKREERLQSVPISVTVVDGAQLTRQNINEIGEITRSSPSLNAAGPLNVLSIRGIGSVSFARSSEGSVGVVVDGVALANTSTNAPQLFDVARVEVLEGPQGTLFGRNSSAGILNIVTNAPDPSKFEVSGHADIGTRNTYVGRAVINLPVADNAALRISGSYNREPDSQYNRFDSTYFKIIGKSGRARFKWDPTADITINLIGDYTKFTRRGGVPYTVYNATPGSLLSSRLAACGVVVAAENQQGCIDGGNDTSAESYGFSGQADMKIGGVTLSSISAYRAFIGRSYASDADNVPVDRLNLNASVGDYRNFSQEFRLTSPTGGFLEYVGGLYYFDGALDTTNTQLGNIAADLGLPFPLGQRIATKSSVTSVAAFGQATLHIAPALRVILGARYGNEHVTANTVGTVTPGAVGAFAGIGTKQGDVSDNYFSYRGGIQFDVTHNVMLYGTYTKGYKGPSINDQSIGPNIPTIVRPEIPHAGEIGMKSTLLSGRLAIDLASFYTKVDDFQAQFFDPTIAQYVFGNAPSLTTKGVSISIFGRPTPGLTLNLGAQYTDAKYGDGYFVACAQLQTAAQGCQTLTNAGGVAIGKADNAGGNRLVGSPEWKVTGSGEYQTRLDGNITAFVQGDVVYTSRINYNAAYDPLDTNAPAAIFGGRLGIRTADGRYGISIFGRNLFDVYRSTIRFASATAAQQLDPKSYSQFSGTDSRRVIGVSLDGKF
jgi:iron complex outermembrane receptor protein